MVLAPSPLVTSWALPENTPVDQLRPLQDSGVWPFNFSKFVPIFSAFMSAGIPPVFITMPGGHAWILS